MKGSDEKCDKEFMAVNGKSRPRRRTSLVILLSMRGMRWEVPRKERRTVSFLFFRYFSLWNVRLPDFHLFRVKGHEEREKAMAIDYQLICLFGREI